MPPVGRGQQFQSRFYEVLQGSSGFLQNPVEPCSTQPVQTLFIVIRILANPLSNLFQKQLAERSARPVFIIGVLHVCLALVCAPVLLSHGAPAISADVWLNMC